MQTLLSAAIMPKAGQEIAIRIKYGLQPDIYQNVYFMFEHILAKETTASNFVNETQVTIPLKASPKSPPSNICRGVMAYKDLSDEDFQELVKLYMEYYYNEGKEIIGTFFQIIFIRNFICIFFLSYL